MRRLRRRVAPSNRQGKSMTKDSSKTVLITGAAGGLGRAVVARLRSAGWRFALVSRDRERLVGIERDGDL